MTGHVLDQKIAHPKEGDLCVWWIPQVPGKPFRVAVASIPEGRRLCEILAAYDDFQYRNHVKPDYCNSGGVTRFEDGEWCDIQDADD